jgi:hypothetical protein
MILPTSDTPLYNHPLPEIEQWLLGRGCRQDNANIHCWHIQQPGWRAELWLDSDQFVVRYFDFGDGDRSIQRAFKYSLSRQDIEDAIFAGP